MDYMFTEGFLGTRAPFFMDFVTLIVAFLPLLVYGAILLARKKMFIAHTITQNIIYIFSIVVVAYFEFGVRVGGGFDVFMSGSGVHYTYALVVLILHIIIALLMLYYWTMLLFSANYQLFKGLLPGRASVLHKKLAVKTFISIIFTSFSGIWVYLLLFVY